MKAKKSLGQNFLTSENIKKEIVSLINPTKDDLVIEIGPGMGAITKYLSKIDTNIICIEIDTDMKPYLSKYETDNVHIIYDDILNVDLNKLLSNYNYQNLYIIGNLPYYITGPILEHLIESKINASSMVFMVQKEVAQRYTAKPKTSEYGYMTLYLDYDYNVSKEIDVPREFFNPIPKVDSAVIKLDIKNIERDIDKEKYLTFLKQCFSHKRKTLNNNLKVYNYKVDSNVRAEELSQDEFIDLYKKVMM